MQESAIPVLQRVGIGWMTTVAETAFGACLGALSDGGIERGDYYF